MTTVLHNIHTAIEWQCAHDALRHAVKRKKITLTYATPEGDITLVVGMRGLETYVTNRTGFT